MKLDEILMKKYYNYYHNPLREYIAVIFYQMNKQIAVQCMDTYHQYLFIYRAKPDRNDCTQYLSENTSY